MPKSKSATKNGNSISEIPGYSIKCLLLSPAMGSEEGMAEPTEGLADLGQLCGLFWLSTLSFQYSTLEKWTCVIYRNVGKQLPTQLRNITEERRPQLHRGVNMKSRKCFTVGTSLNTQTCFLNPYPANVENRVSS